MSPAQPCQAYDFNHMVPRHQPLPVELQSLLPATLHGLCEQRRYERGALLFETGRRPGSMFFISDGEVTLQRIGEDGEIVVLQRTRHGLVGEASLHGFPRRAMRHTAVLGISVRAESRGRGVGDRLVTAVIAWAPTAGVTRIELHVLARNTIARQLYEKHGFVIEGERRRTVYAKGEYLDDVVMALLL